jgi:hypothetical protein
VLVTARLHELAVRRDDLQRAHRVARRPVAAGQPAEAAAERVADGADRRRRADQRGEPVLLGGGQDRCPLAAGTDPGGARLDVDLDLIHLPGHEQHAVDRHGDAVAGGLHAEPDAELGGERHGGDDVTDVGGDDDRHRPVGRRPVPRQGGGGETVVAGHQHLAVDAMAQRRQAPVEVVGRGDRGRAHVPEDGGPGL